ncbi:MAG: 16S rRNA (cytosine(967)-C(5))-methyltransferase RsmB [Lachnospiraceae bacterium]|nr:16S rRNA (cytosine(967)-C(5))-methyltransferase RsmB [Lachnospiraceae bacterium]
MDLRRIILETLLAMEKDDKSYAIIGQVLDKYAYLDRRDRAFIKRVLEGCIERRIELDYITDQKSRTPVSKMKPVIRAIMRMSVYQLKYMDSVPSSAVCNEAVKLAVSKGFSGLKGFVNGVLRSVSSGLDDIEYPDPGTDEGLSVRYSCPLWLVTQLAGEIGRDNTEAMLKAALRPSRLYIRINVSKITPSQYAAMLDEAGIRHGSVPRLSCAMTVDDIDTVTALPGYDRGLFNVQDLGSMLVTELAGINKGDTVFDVCAAPGGKSMHALDILNGSGHLYSFDISDRKLELIKDNAARSGYSNIDIMKADASVFDPRYEGMADVLIADLPCSGIGVMGRKNDIKYNLTPEREVALVKIQREILANVSRYVKPGGTLVYSTCTVHRAENEDNFRWIAKELPFEPVAVPGLLPEGYVQFIPGVDECDGFFISRFRRIKDK